MSCTGDTERPRPSSSSSSSTATSSIIGFTDGESIRLLPPAQDHKALLDGDRGPNTGGMGAFSPVPQVGEALMRRLHEAVIAPTLAGLRAERFDYRGLLYFGLMLTAAGPRLLEYNVRLGDPEAEVLLPLLKTDLAEVAHACLSRRLAGMTLEIDPGHAVGVVLAAPGYPDKPETGQPILGLDDAGQDALVFHAGTRKDGARVVTSGGRVLIVVARDADLGTAIEKAYRAVGSIRFDGMQLRRDIGRRNMAARKQRIAILVSGRGSNMEAILRSAQDGVLADCAQVVLVFSNNPEAQALPRAAALGVATACIDSRGQKRDAFDAALLNLLEPHALDYLVLAGYMRILSPVVVRRYAGRIVNIHPADTRQHQGLHGYEWAFEKRLETTKVTVHLVDEGLDTGGILAQRSVDLRGATSLEEVERRGLAVEHRLYGEALAELFRRQAWSTPE